MLADYRVRNRETHAWTEPARRPEYFQAAYWEWTVSNAIRRATDDEEYRFMVFVHGADADLAGLVNFYNIARGPIQSALLGYSIDTAHMGRGIATEAVTEAMRFAFVDIDLKRIEAGVLPENAASIRVLQKCGLSRVGTTRQSLRVMGEWKDHDLYETINPYWKGTYQ